MSTTFATAKQFADFISTSIGRSAVLDFNKREGQSRINALSGKVAFLVRYDYLRGTEGVLLENTMYGLTRFLDTGRATTYARKALFALNTRQLCELVFSLTQETHNIEEHCRMLNKKYAPAA